MNSAATFADPRLATLNGFRVRLDPAVSAPT